MNFFRNNWILLGFVVNIVIIGIVGWSSVQRIKIEEQTKELQYNKARLQILLREVIIGSNRIGNRAKGFAFTKNRGYLLDLNPEEIHVKLNHVNDLIIAGSHQKERVQKLRSLVDSLVKVNMGMIELGKTAADEKMLFSVGEENIRLIYKFLQLTDTVEEEELAAYDKVVAANNGRDNFYHVLQWILLSTAFMLLFVVYFLISYYLKKRKKAENELSSTKNLLQSVIDYSNTPIFVKGVEGSYIFANREFEALVGTEKIVGKTDEEILKQEMAEKFRALDLDVIKNGHEVRVEETFKTKDNSRTFLIARFPIRDARNKIYAVGGIATDITERRVEGERLVASEAELNIIFNNGPDAIIVMDETGKITKWNNKAERLFGYSENEVLGSLMHQLILPEQYWEQYLIEKKKMEISGKEGSSNRTFEFSAKDKKNKEIDIELTISVTSINNRSVFIAFAEEIISRKRAEREVTEAKNFLNSIVENIPDMIFVKDAKELRFVRFNKAGEKLLGYSKSDLIGKNDYDFFPKEQADFFTSKDREVLEKGQLVEIEEEEINTVNGKRLLHTKKIPICDESGKPIYLLGISYDVTESRKLEKERIKMESQLRENEERLELILENIGEGVIVADASREIVLSNEMAEEIFETDEKMGTDWSDHYKIYYPDGKTVFPSQYLPLEKALRGETIDTQIILQHPITRKTKLLQVCGRPIFGENNVVVAAVSTIRDITEMKKLERELEESKKSMGYTAHIDSDKKELPAEIDERKEKENNKVPVEQIEVLDMPPDDD